ncbi:hypothetical protein ACM9HF_08275 [Colwellia sp. RE-S-Sl-9]
MSHIKRPTKTVLTVAVALALSNGAIQAQENNVEKKKLTVIANSKE